MAKYVENPLINFRNIARSVSRLLRNEVENSGMQYKEIAKITGISATLISQGMGSTPSNNEDLYKGIARAIGLSDSKFEEIKLKAIQEHYKLKDKGGGSDPYYSLAEKEHLTEGQIKKVRSFIQFVKSESE